MGISRTCEACGQKVTIRHESMSKGLVDTLLTFADAVRREGRNKIHLQKEVNLTKNQYNNFQKLRYHGLVYKVKDQPGYWLLTRNGGSFLRNELAIPKEVFVFNNHIVEKGHKLVRISEFYKTSFDEDYWQRNFSASIFAGYNGQESLF